MSASAPQARDHFRMRSYQRAPWLAKQQGCKRFVEVLHRRAGKDRNWLSITFLSMLERVGVYFHVFPALNQARRDIWDNIIQEKIDGVEMSHPFMDMFPSEFVVARNETEMSITLINGSRWQLMGADSPEAIKRLRGPNPIGVVFSEYAHMDPLAWSTLEPVLAENGGWAAFVSTPNGENHFMRLYQYAQQERSWFCQLKTIAETRRDAEGEDGSVVIEESEVEGMRARGEREEFLQQEYYCSFKGYTKGTIYGDLLEAAEAQRRIDRFAHNVSLPVGTCWDLGTSDAVAVWFYQRPDKDRVVFIDFAKDTLKDMSWWAHLLRENKRYIYGRMCLPWDGRIAETYMYSMGFRNIAVAERPAKLHEAIDVVRRALPQFYWDKVACEQGLYHLRNYKSKWDEKLGVFTKEPVHDEHSHAADALRSGVACGFDPMLYASIADMEVKVESAFDPRVSAAPAPVPWC